jgi:hypothetical protein
MAQIITRSGAKGTRYVAWVRVAGHPPQARTFERKTDAREWARNLETDLKRNRDFPQRHHAKKTLGELIARYREEGLPVPHRSQPQGRATVSAKAAKVAANSSRILIVSIRRSLHGQGRTQ